MRSRSTRWIAEKPWPSDAAATLAKGTAVPSAVRMRSFSTSASERRSLARVAHHHADVVATARDALRLLAVEGLANLAGEVREREAERLGRGQQVGTAARACRRGTSR